MLQLLCISTYKRNYTQVSNKDLQKIPDTTNKEESIYVKYNKLLNALFNKEILTKGEYACLSIR